MNVRRDCLAIRIGSRGRSFHWLLLIIKSVGNRICLHGQEKTNSESITNFRYHFFVYILLFMKICF